ncbi:MAG: roadblock/LC7 domain-containing protein [Candidatus Lokiarchaeota archaeon]|nr:roadblock/LC7 domain-containing protein [Candidatus Lokiarchaeota archaeon]
MKWDDKLNVLIELIKQNSGVKDVRIVSTEGLPIGSTLPKGVDETRIAAMTAALLSLAEKSIMEMNKGEFDQLYVKGSDGYLLILRAGPNAVLKVSTTKDVRVGLIFLDCKRTCEKIDRTLSGDFDDKDDKNGSN